MTIPPTKAARIERLRYCTAHIRKLAPLLLQYLKQYHSSTSLNELYRLAKEPGTPQTFEVVVSTSQLEPVVQCALETMTALLHISPKDNLPSATRSLWLFVLRYAATFSTSQQTVEHLRSELDDFLYMHCDLDFSVDQSSLPVTITAQMEKVKLCKLHTKKMSLLVYANTVVKNREKFVSTLTTQYPDFSRYTRLGIQCLECVLAHSLRSKQGWTPEEALWDLVQQSKTMSRDVVAVQLYEFLDMYAYLDISRDV